MIDFLHFLAWAWARYWDERNGRIKPEPPLAPRGDLTRVPAGFIDLDALDTPENLDRAADRMIDQVIGKPSPR